MEFCDVFYSIPSGIIFRVVETARIEGCAGSGVRGAGPSVPRLWAPSARSESAVSRAPGWAPRTKHHQLSVWSRDARGPYLLHGVLHWVLFNSERNSRSGRLSGASRRRRRVIAQPLAQLGFGLVHGTPGGWVGQAEFLFNGPYVQVREVRQQDAPGPFVAHG